MGTPLTSLLCSSVCPPWSSCPALLFVLLSRSPRSPRLLLLSSSPAPSLLFPCFPPSPSLRSLPSFAHLSSQSPVAFSGKVWTEAALELRRSLQQNFATKCTVYMEKKLVSVDAVCMWISRTLGGVLLVPGNVCNVKALQYWHNKTHRCSTVAEDMAHEMTPIVSRQEKASCYWFPPTLQTTQPPKQKKIQQALFHKSKAFKKIIDIWSSKSPTYLPVHQQSVGINPPSTFLCHFLPKHLPVHWGHLLNPFLWHQQCPRWLSPVHGFVSKFRTLTAPISYVFFKGYIEIYLHCQNTKKRRTKI